MNEKKKKPLRPDEIARLLGAEPPEKIEVQSLDPISLGVLATRIATRIRGGRGRPTDKSWDTTRKIPMKRRTWDELNELSLSLEGKDLRIAPGQLGAIALEIGLRTVTRGEVQVQAADQSFALMCDYDIAEECFEEAQALCAAGSEKLW